MTDPTWGGLSAYGPVPRRGSGEVSLCAMAHKRPHVVIIGSGFGGLFAAQELKDADVDVTIVGKTVYHLFQPLLYQVATGILSPGEIAPSTIR